MNRLPVYRLLGRLPGKVGARYRRKFLRKTAPARFEAALHRTRGKTCIDLGAHLGVYTRKMARTAGRVVAFEPDPWTAAALVRNTANLDNVVIENRAAGTANGCVTLFRHPGFADDPARYSVSSTVVPAKTNVVRGGG